MAINGIGSKPVVLPTLSQTTASSAQPATAATGFSDDSSFSASPSSTTSSVFTDPAVTGPMSKYMNNLNGPTATDKNSSYSKIGVAQLSALTNPAQARQLLANGVTDPSTGQQLSPPVDPNSALGQTLTKVVNGTATASDITTAGSQVNSKAQGSNSMMDSILASISQLTQQAEDAQKKAATDPDASPV